MQIVVNGTEEVFNEQLTIETLIERLGFDARKIAVERNKEIVPKGDFSSVKLCEGDTVEIVHFIGGGAREA
tara:strand:- start:58 stop:270 length:213 start_codon:yes stop_codon:yes gene_type:complete